MAKRAMMTTTMKTPEIIPSTQSVIITVSWPPMRVKSRVTERKSTISRAKVGTENPRRERVSGKPH